MFESALSFAIRQALLDSQPPKSLPYQTAAHAVIFLTDHCSVGCAHCLYSAKATQASRERQLSASETSNLVCLLAEADVRQVVLSGGGEPLEHLACALQIISQTRSIEEAVIHTSANFAVNDYQTNSKLSQLAAASSTSRVSSGLPPVQLILRISHDKFHSKRIPLSNIRRILDWVENNQTAGQISIIIRSLESEIASHDGAFFEHLGISVYPSAKEAPVIDKLVVRWGIRKTFSYPIIYKPRYFLGRGKIPDRSVAAESSGLRLGAIDTTGVNSTIRGPRGQSLDYYETLQKGYSYWRLALKENPIYLTPIESVAFGLAIFCDATGNISLNGGAPDNYVPVAAARSWDRFRALLAQDPIQRTLLEYGPEAIIRIAREVEPEVDRFASRTNFLFSLPLYAMATPALRLYVHLRLLQEESKRHDSAMVSPGLGNLFCLDRRPLQKKYADEAPSLSSQLKGIIRGDPFRGGAQRIWSDSRIGAEWDTSYP